MKNTIAIVLLSLLAVSANAETYYRKAGTPVQRFDLRTTAGGQKICINNNKLFYQCSKWWQQQVEPKKNTPCVAGCIGGVSVNS